MQKIGNNITQAEKYGSYWGVKPNLIDSKPKHLFERSSEVVLSPRLRNVADLQMEGYSRKGVAEKLGISLNTVNGYVKQIYSFFGVGSRVEFLIAYSNFSKEKSS